MKFCRLQRGQRGKAERGFTLIELIIASTILIILSSLALPTARVVIKREKEHRLREALWEMRDAIDRYKDAADRGGFQTKVDSQNYPPDLETLVKGVDVQGKKIRFLRKIPIDPMTRAKDWKVDSEEVLLTPEQTSTGVTDVHSASETISSFEGTAYNTW